MPEDQIEDSHEGIGREIDPSLARAAFSQPAVAVDNVLVTEREGVVRISVLERGMQGEVYFRGAAAMSLAMAGRLSGILANIVQNAKPADE